MTPVTLSHNIKYLIFLYFWFFDFPVFYNGYCFHCLATPALTQEGVATALDLLLLIKFYFWHALGYHHQDGILNFNVENFGKGYHHFDFVAAEFAVGKD